MYTKLLLLTGYSLQALPSIVRQQAGGSPSQACLPSIATSVSEKICSTAAAVAGAALPLQLSPSPHESAADGGRSWVQGTTADTSWAWGLSDKGTPAERLLDKLRWACLGPNFDWTNRQYLYEQPYRIIPAYLVHAAQRCARLASG